MPGGGWELDQTRRMDLPVASYRAKPLQLNRAIIQKGSVKQLLYFWFDQRGRILTNAYQLKWFLFWDALTKQRTDGSMVRVITAVYPNETIENAEARLQAFTREVAPILTGFLHGD